MIQRSFAGLKFFSPVFSTPCLSSGPESIEVMRDILQSRYQQRCAQTISANVLKSPFARFSIHAPDFIKLWQMRVIKTVRIFKRHTNFLSAFGHMKNVYQKLDAIQ